MEFSYVETVLCLFVLFSVTILPLLHLLFSRPKCHHHLSPGNTPPGGTGWPVIGETLEFLSAGRKGFPEEFIFNRIRKHASHVFKTHLMGEKFAVLSGPAGNKFLFTNENKLVQSWWPRSVDKIFPSTSNSSSRDQAILLRKMVPNFLRPETLQRYIPIMDQIARTHFSSGWENKDQVVVYPLTKNYTILVACRLFVSVEDPKHVAKFAEHFSALASGIFSVPVDLPGTPFHHAIRASSFIRKELLGIIKKRRVDLAEARASPTQDILSHMLLATDENGKFMNELEIVDKIIALLLAGHCTATSACACIVNYLAELPEIYDSVLKEQMEIAKSKASGDFLNWNDIQKMKYSWNVVCEVLRLAPPIQGAFREAISDFIYNGFSIPKGWKLYWSANSTHQNPEFFPEPQKFDPSRFEGRGPPQYSYVPFGGGPRMCPAKEYARLEMLIFMHHLVKRFRLEKAIPDERIGFNPSPIPAQGLPVRLYPHKP